MREPRTIIHALHDQAARLSDRPALWTKRGSTYLPTSWRSYAQKVQQFALGLRSLGFAPGAALGILGFNREEWVVADLSALALGGVAVGLYTSSSPEQLQYVLAHCEAEILVVENAALLEKVQAVRQALPRLRTLVVMDPPKERGQGVVSFAEVLQAGAGQDTAPYWERVNALSPEGLALLIYTSGTTGHPKGVMLSHRNLTWTVTRVLQQLGLEGDPQVLLSYLPLSHIAEQMISVHGPLVAGFQVYFAQSLEALPQNLKEARPTAFFGVPRVWEKFMAKAQEALAQQKGHRRALLDWARSVALRRHHLELMGELAPPRLELEYQLARRLVFERLKARLGLERAQVLATSAAPIGREVLEFFASLDLIITEAYGQSEVTGPTSGNARRATRLGSVGRPLPGVEVRIASDGEILVKGPNVCQGYFKDPAGTAELFEDGWLRSGDLGELDRDGYLWVTGRKKELIVTSGGKKTAPAAIEAKLTALEPLGNALVVGDRHNYLVALLALDPQKVPAFAAARGLPRDPAALARDPSFRSDLQRRIEEVVHPTLARFETIKRFEVLPHDFTVEGGELTPTLKVRRKVVEAKYAELIRALYDEGATAAG